MSQERTEQRDPVKDRARLQESRRMLQNGEDLACAAWAVEPLLDISGYWLSEIDRLNAVITDTQHDRDQMCRLVEDKEHEIRDLTAKVQERDREIERSGEIIVGQDEQINRQAEEIDRLKSEAESALKWGQEQRDNAKALKQAWYDALPTGDAEATAENMRAEIERLRAEMENVANMLEQFHTLTYGFAIEMADIQAARLRAALKGAE